MRESVLAVRREAQRAMAASTSLGRAPSVFSQMPQSLQASLMGQPSYLPPVPTSTSHARTRPSSPDRGIVPAVPILDPTLDVASLARIRELESQVQALKSDNEAQRAQIVRYAERWKKLKETAKRKQRSSKDGASTSGPPEKIPEEDEGARSDSDRRAEVSGA